MSKGFSGKYGVSLQVMNAFLRSVKLSSGRGKIAKRIESAFAKHGNPKPDDVNLEVFCNQQRQFIKEKGAGFKYIRGEKSPPYVERNAPIGSAPDATSDEFLASFAWRAMRIQVLRKYGAKCMCCGATPAHGAVMNVDHIKPRKLFPQLALDIENLQVLCHECNHGKGNWDQTDWRPKSQASLSRA